MPNLCTHKDCYAYGRYCRIPGHMKDAPAKKVEPIPKRSKKMEGVIKQAKKMYAVFLAKPENKYCRIRFDGCTKIATTVNHTNGRDINILNEDDWEPCCWNCNGKIESEHERARENGHKKARHHKMNQRGRLNKHDLC